jgi:hypothetical protein
MTGLAAMMVGVMLSPSQTYVSDVIQHAYDRNNFTFQLAIACEVDEVLITDGNMDGVASILHYAFSALMIPDKKSVFLK